jgi:hypothetical protein
MISDAQLEAAVTQGILTPEQARRLRDLAQGVAPAASEPGETAADPDDEKFRLIGGFNDVFVTIGVGLLVAAIFALAGVFDFRPGFAVLAMISAWGLSEYFSRRMRLALPSIALAAMFAGGAAFVGLSLGGGPDGAAITVPLAAALAAVAHERRFHVPADWAIAALGAVWTLLGVVSLIAPDLPANAKAVLYAALGLAIFAAAARVDASDLARTTLRSDIAFWLHLIAAPMIVHGAMPVLTGSASSGVSELSSGQAVMMLFVFAALGLVAIVIDRRALLVSGLVYAGVAIGYLLSQGVAKDLGMSLTLLGLAALVLGLSAGWRTLRRNVLALLPLGSLARFIPPAT